MKITATLLFAIVGLINFAPLMGVLGTERLMGLYGVDATSPDLALLLRHRAILFGIIGGYVLFATARPAHRTLASIFGFISLLGYMALYLAIPNTNAELGRVFQIDVIAVILLIVAVIFDRKTTS